LTHLHIVQDEYTENTPANTKCLGIIIGNCHLLISLHLDLAIQFPNACLKNISSTCPRLNSLALNRWVDNEGVGYIAKCESMTELYLRGCQGITDVGWKKLGTGCKQLEVLGLRYSQITNKGLRHIFTKNTKIIDLDLSYCLNVTKAGLKFISTVTQDICIDISRCKISEWDPFLDQYPDILLYTTDTQTMHCLEMTESQLEVFASTLNL